MSDNTKKKGKPNSVPTSSKDLIVAALVGAGLDGDITGFVVDMDRILNAAILDGEQTGAVITDLPEALQSEISENLGSEDAAQSWLDDLWEELTGTLPASTDQESEGLVPDLATVGKNLKDETLDAVGELFGTESPLVLRFGTVAYDRSGKVDQMPRRNPVQVHQADPTLMLLNPANSISKRALTPICGIKTGDSEHDLLPITKGLTVIIAPANLGKTTLMARVFRALLDPKGSGPQIPSSFVPWNERETYSFVGGPEYLVKILEDKLQKSAEFIGVDSLREWSLGGTAPGKKGVNTQFMMNLTTWKHQFADRDACCWAVINPNNNDPEVIASIKEALRGSTDGFLTLTSQGKATLEHVYFGRAPREVKLEDREYQRVTLEAGSSLEIDPEKEAASLRLPDMVDSKELSSSHALTDFVSASPNKA